MAVTLDDRINFQQYALYPFTRQQHFTARNDVMSATLK